MSATKVIVVDPALQKDANGAWTYQKVSQEAALSEGPLGYVYVSNVTNESIITLRDKKGMAIVGCASYGKEDHKGARWFRDFIKAFKKNRDRFEADSEGLFLHVLAKKGNDKVERRVLRALLQKSGCDIEIPPKGIKLYDDDRYGGQPRDISFNTSAVIYNIDPADGLGGIHENIVL